MAWGTPQQFLDSGRSGVISSQTSSSLVRQKKTNEVVLKTLDWLGYASNHLVNPHGSDGGGLALLWKQVINLEVLHSITNYIDTIIIQDGKLLYVTFVYGEPDQTKRKEVWNKLTLMGLARDAPWFLTGDFNEIIDNAEKQEGIMRPESSFVDFRSFLSENDMYDLQHTSNFLSWRGTRNNHTVLCILDRAMAKCAWFERFPTARSEYLRFEGSDHRPIVSYLTNHQKKTRGLFRFDRRLKDNVEVQNLISENWKTDGEIYVEQRITKCRRAIIK